ncbi:type IV secretion system protein [soil metagenome]
MIDNPLSKPKFSRPQYDQAASWSADIHGSLRASRRLAWILAAVAVGIAGLEAIAIATLAPLKTVVPYTILVDRQTGYAETVRGLELGKLTQDSAVTQSFIVQYVLARETFDATDLSANYRKVSLWSDGQARSDYQRVMDRGNAMSPLNLYPSTATVQVVIKSVSLLSPTSALVRFDTRRQDAGAMSSEQQSYASVLTFRYTNAAMKTEDRFTNPLGFQVTRYRRDTETVGATPVLLPGAPVTIVAPLPTPPVTPMIPRSSSSLVAPTLVLPQPVGQAAPK